MNAWRNRTLIDYAQHVIYNLLPRTSGAPFLGDTEGPAYFSVIDDTEIEIMKALWEGDDYLRIPPARRVWGQPWFDQKRFYQMAVSVADTFKLLAQTPEALDHLELTRLDRGIMAVLALQLPRRWKQIHIKHKSYPMALVALQDYCWKRAELRHGAEIFSFEKSLSDLEWRPERAITLVSNREDFSLPSDSKVVLKYDATY